MNLEKLFNLIFENPNNINIQYSNINGEEKLLINGEEVKKELEEHLEKFDDSETLDKIDEFQNNINEIDDELFIQLMDRLNEVMDTNEFDRLLAQRAFNREESECVCCLINQSNSIIRELISEEIERLEELKARFK